MVLTREQAAALTKLKVRAFAEDLRRAPFSKLRAEFAASSSGRVMLLPLVRNVVYQAASFMLAGQAPKVDGNLRSLYYQWVKPILSRVPDFLKTRVDPYDEMLNTLELFVAELGLFTYRDLEIVDERWENRWFSDGRNPHLLVFAEKNGFVKFLQQVSREFGVHAVALGGSPSHVSTEYLADQLKTRAPREKAFTLFGITDYDPSGEDIARAFLRQLRHQGLRISEHHPLILPAAYTEEERELFRFPIPAKYPTRLKRWFKAGGGLGGEAFGLEADSLPKARLRALLAEKMRPSLRPLLAEGRR